MMNLQKRQSRVAKRMDEHHQRKKRAPSLNLVALMDIFTILVFFLLVSSSDGQRLNDSSVKLPLSTADQLPKETLIVTVNDREILLQGQQIASIGEVLASKKQTIETLEAQLQVYAKKAAAPFGSADSPEREITLLADKNTPYALLKKIMLTCSQNEYSRISFAVIKKAEAEAT